jgi:hypothetical protein
LRNLPVNTEIASTLTIEKIKEVNPHFVICCGMAEKSKYLHISVTTADMLWRDCRNM